MDPACVVTREDKELVLPECLHLSLSMEIKDRSPWLSRDINTSLVYPSNSKLEKEMLALIAGAAQIHPMINAQGQQSRNRGPCWIMKEGSNNWIIKTVHVNQYG